MEHSLEDSLNLEGALGEIDFENAEDVVVSQSDITLEAVKHEGNIEMEFEHIEEQPIHMDTGNEEIIDFMGDQFNLQEYSVQDDQTTGVTTTEESNQQVVLASQADAMIDLQFEPHNIIPVKGRPKYISVKAAPPARAIASKKNETTVVSSIPRQIAIAPKPPKLVPVPIAPKPVALVSNKANFKKVPLSSIQGAPKGSVLAQIGKQLVMMPSGSSQKIKLVTTKSSGMPTIQYIKRDTDQAQLVAGKSVQTGRPVMAKVILQGQSNVDLSNQPAVITKIMPSSSTGPPQARYIMQQKTVPISMGHKVLLSSPTKPGMVYAKRQQLITFNKSMPQSPKLMPAPAQGTTTKKVLISANPQQNVILKTTAPPKTAQITKDGKVVLQSQRSELHQINVPGKGIQYIRLITNQTPVSSKSVTNTQTASGSSPKTYVVSNNKGKFSTGKATHPPPLVYSGKVDKFPQKLVRIAAAPVTAKSIPVSQASSRSAQSLLAPLSPMDRSTKMEETNELPLLESKEAFDASLFEVGVEQAEVEETIDKDEYEDRDVRATTEPDSKASLRAIIADTVGDTMEYNKRKSPVDDEDSNSMEHLVTRGREDEHLIVISNYIPPDARDDQDDSKREIMDEEGINSYQSPNTPPALSDGEVPSGDLAFKPRRACNCTKSQCLKLYCDCFANGEFCNHCNCNNCHNNLENEELRQKAIRSCLERNPNAFRPKIGKTKAGGPEIIRRHNKGCNCKRSGCLKNYCECYEAKIACTAMCKCVGCRNVEETLHRARRREPPHALYRPPALADPAALTKQPCSFMTTEVIEAVCQCLLAASVDAGDTHDPPAERDHARDVIEEFSRCLQDIISAAHHHQPQGCP